MKAIFVWAVICSVVSIGLFACGGNNNSSLNEPATVTGTVTLNSSVTAKKWFVAIDTDAYGGNGWVASATGTVTGSTFTYTIPDVPAGTYYLYTVTDVDGTWGTDPSGPAGNGDYVGVLGWDGSGALSANLAVPATGTVTANMTTITYGAADATVTGTVTLNSFVTAKKWFVAIDTDADGGNGWVASATGTVTGNTFTYTIQNVPAGTYYLYTVTDVDDTWGANPSGPAGNGDYVGVFPTWDGVQPPPKGLIVPSAGTVTANMTTIVLP